MSKFAQLEESLNARLADLLSRAREIEDDLRHPLEADSSEQAIDLADDEALAGVDEVLHEEITQIRQALLRLENGTYGTCGNCGAEIAHERLVARPIATTCIQCAAAA